MHVFIHCILRMCLPCATLTLAMVRKRAHVLLPEDLLADIDALVGPRGRTAFLIEVLRNEVNRRRLLQMLSNPEPIWKDEDHPELADGAEAWVRRMRDQDMQREIEKLGPHWLGEGKPRE